MGAAWVFVALICASPFAAALLCAIIRLGKTQQPPIGRFVKIDGVWYRRGHADAVDLRRPPSDR